MKQLLWQNPTYVRRTYRGGKLIREFHGEENPEDSFFPEDWISSFVEAKNKIVVPKEGLTRVTVKDQETGKMEEKLINEAAHPEDFGRGRSESGVLIKFLDSFERLGIQVHPTKEYARRIFHSEYGKTECWHILDTRPIDGPACVYLGFKEFVTRDLWQEYFEKQDIAAMLNAMHRFEVRKGQTILVCGGVPHAIGAGCFLLEIQEPSDYTMRMEKVTVAGDVMTPMQIHYGVGIDNMLDCFDYTPRSREEIEKMYILPARDADEEGNRKILVSYEDTPCFGLQRLDGGKYHLESRDCVTAVAIADGGTVCVSGSEEKTEVHRGNKIFIPADLGVDFDGVQMLLCYPPQK